MSVKEEAKIKMKWWFWLSNVWRTLDYVLPSVSFLSSMVVVYSEAANSNIISVMLFSIIAATLTMLSFAIEPKKHMKNYRRAYYYLYNAMLSYEKSTFEDEMILEIALRKGENIINDSYDVDPSNEIQESYSNNERVDE